MRTHGHQKAFYQQASLVNILDVCPMRLYSYLLHTHAIIMLNNLQYSTVRERWTYNILLPYFLLKKPLVLGKECLLRSYRCVRAEVGIPQKSSILHSCILSGQPAPLL